MDFQELLSQADYNKSEVQYKAHVQKYSTELPPPKKVPKANVQSENIRRFLEKKKAEEEAKLAEARKQRERLLAIRAQNTKNNKKAKIMASRTKDNDFSKIRLTEDEIEARNKRETELRKTLIDKMERMKARIEMEEKEKLLPRKRKRKSKNPESTDASDHVEAVVNEPKEPSSIVKDSKNSVSHKDKIHKPKPAAPALSFHDLLKIAQTKQHEPVQIVAPKKEEVKLMTKKERKEYEEELARKKRKQERLLRGESGILPKSEKSENKKPVVIHVGKDVSKSASDISKSASDPSKFKIPKGPVNASSNKNVPVKQKEVASNVNGKLNGSSSNSIGKSEKSPLVNGHKKIKDEKETEIRQKMALQKKNGLKTHGDQATSSKPPKIDEAALKAALEKEIREKMEKEMEEKIAAKFALFQSQIDKINEKKSETPTQAKKISETSSSVPKKVMEKPQFTRKDFERFLAMKKQQAMQQRESKPKLPAKKPFHVNPYLDPPRRLLEPQRPPRPPIRRRIESDDEDDDDDDDMNDFIVDSSQNEEDYSKYIQEIFGYDRNRYVDDDEDEIVETSFSEQLKEETRSARLGYLEDLEEERLERLENMRKKKKKMKK